MSSDYAQCRLLNWLDALVRVPDVQSSERPCKRPRLDDDENVQNQCSGQILNGDRATRLRTPPNSGSGAKSFSSKLPNMPPGGSSRDTRPEEDDEAQEHGQVSSRLALQVELTPRPARRKASAMDSGSPVSWVPSTLSQSSSKASSKASKITRNSSPSKQLRNAELEETGFSRADLRNDTKPGLLDALTTELEKIGGGFGILPKNLQEEVRTHCQNYGVVPS